LNKGKPMKIVLLQGSARKKGNTARVLGWVEQELKNQDHDVQSIYLANKHLNGCLGCARCKDVPKNAGGKIGCIQKDDIPGILAQMVHAQAVIFASPLYFWGVTAQLKAVIDRSYSLYTQYHQPDHASLVEGQRQALLMTGGGPWDNNAEAAFTAFSRIRKPHKSVHADPLYIGRCTTPEDMGADIKKQAIEFAGRIVA
jgi:multimeric flavodoxin WrbA